MPTDQDTVDAYNAAAAEWAERLRNGNNPAHRFLEKPAMYGKLPDLTGKRVLCVGCGTGEECVHLASLGASSVTGIDISKGLIDAARETVPNMDFRVMDMENITFEANSFDYAYSSLTLHYVESWGRTLSEIRRVLAPGGTLLASTHHPVKWGSQVTRGKESDSFLMGYDRLVSGVPSVYGDYQTTRKVQDTWFGTLKVTYFHRPFSAIMRDILDSGMALMDIIEPMPIEEAAAENPSFWEIHRKIPLFMIIELRKA